ncbi:MAG: septal ring lytic transglycosylase RlpA family protein [Spirochaetes bacterium]|nr:septal ring lytic transglycosylase RlpA family protein [Spirochaetota bacterium]
MQRKCKASIPYFLILILAILIPMTVFADPTVPESTGKESVQKELTNLTVYQEGIASWYAGEFDGKLTANGEVYDASKVSAAHKDLAFGTIVRVTNLDNGLTLEVRINDRGPYVGERIIDLSRGAAELLDMVDQGIAPVTLELLFVPKLPESAYARPGDTGWVKLQLGSFSSAVRVLEQYGLLMDAGFFPIIEKTEAGSYRLMIRWLNYDDLPAYTLALNDIGIVDILVMSEISRE